MKLARRRRDIDTHVGPLPPHPPGFAGRSLPASGARLKRLPRPSIARVLRHVAVVALLADVVLLVVAMALGGVDGHLRRAAGPLGTPVLLGNGRNGFFKRFGHQILH